MELKSILAIYGKATGQIINLEKSAISFGSKVDIYVKTGIQEVMEIYNEGGT